MELSILIAKIFSVIYLASGIAVLFATVNFENIVKDFEKSPALTFVAGCVGIAAGLVLLQFHNLWVKNWTVVITILFWCMLIGGVIAVIFPKSLSYKKGFIKNSRLLGICMILFGMLAGYFGFIF